MDFEDSVDFSVMSTAESPEDDPDYEIPSSPIEPVESMETLIEIRIQKLNNRLIILQQTKRVTRKKEDSEGNLEQTGGEDEDEDEISELELVERELEELLHQKNNLHKENPNETVNGAGPVFLSPCKIETPEGGVYTLPPPLPSVHDPPDDEPKEEPLPEDPVPEEPVPEEPVPEEPVPEDPVPEDPVPEDPVPEDPVPEDPVPSQEQENQEQEHEDVDIKEIQPADTLGRDGAFTQCPSCEELVFTQTKKFNGDSVWLMCCLCTMLGGCAGLCLIPFCLDKLKSVRHKCPQCQAVIHTMNPF